MKRNRLLVLLTSFGLAMSFLMAGCDVDSGDETYRDVDINVNGVYRNTDSTANNGFLVSTNSGYPITQLDLRQAGDQLEAIDNNGHIFYGTIGAVDGLTASFSLEGTTTVGNKGTIVGTIIATGESTENNAKMQGQWVESTFFATVYGEATVPVTEFAISPQNPTLNTNNQRVTLSAQGGSGSYRWRVEDTGLGTLQSSNGANVVYVRLQAGDNTVYLTDEANSALNATNNIIQPASDLAISGPETMALQDTQAFTASGGSGTYNWSVQDGSLGSPSYHSGSTFNYKATSSGEQKIFLSDGDAIRTQVVTQSSSDLVIQGVSSMLAGTTEEFTAVGGSGSYTWSIQSTGIGTPQSGSGSTFSYKATSAGTQVLYVRDSENNTAELTVNQSSTLTFTGPSTITVNEENYYLATGGLGNYEWSVSDTTIGTPDTGTGVTFSYTPTGVGTQTIYLTDQQVTVAMTVIQQ